jgi:hypothetical protein
MRMDFRVKILSVVLLLFLGCGYCFERLRCWWDAGPYYGKKIKVDQAVMVFDQEIKISSGFFKIKDGSAGNAPIIVFTDQSGTPLWSRSLTVGESARVPELTKITPVELIEYNDGKRLSFFNQSYSEPGDIFLTYDYSFSCICLKIM